MTDPRPIRIATRASKLAMWQAHYVKRLLEAAAPARQVEIVTVSTIGDRDQSEPLYNLGAFGVFTREVQKVVLEGTADIAVHSLKDLPTEPVPGLTLAAVPPRGETHDVILFPQSKRDGHRGWDSLPEGAIIGTGSIRRRAQLAHQRPDLEFHEARGNVETRLRKLDDEEFAALVLAAAGLVRLGLDKRIDSELRPPLMFPAIGQGALGIECRADDGVVCQLLEKIDDAKTRRAVSAERTLLHALRGGCHAPIGAATRDWGDKLELQAVVLSPDGVERLSATATATDAVELGKTVAEQLRHDGADRLMAVP